MTVSSIVPVNNYTGNSSTKIFDFDFLIEDEKELVVQHQDKNGVISILQYGVDYSINEIGNKNGSYIEFPINSSSYSILQPDEQISLALSLQIKQESEFHNSSYFNLDILEWTFDYIVRILQIMNRKIERCVKVEESIEISPDEIINSLNDKYEKVHSSHSQIVEISKLIEENKNIVIQQANEAFENAEFAKAQAELAKEKAKEAGLIIGETISILCSDTYVPECCLPCNGGEYSKEQFKDLWENYIAKGEEKIIQEPWQTSSCSGNTWHDIKYINGKYIAVGDGGKVMKSSDGITWDSPVTPAAYAYLKAIASNDVGDIIVVAADTDVFLRSTDGGENFSNSYISSGSWISIAFGNNLFVTLEKNGAIAYSSDGGSWTRKDIYDNSGTSIQLNDIKFADGKFVVLINNGSTMTSTDGINWSDPVIFDTNSVGTGWNNFCYGDGKWLAVSSNGYFSTSTDGINWSEPTQFTTNSTASSKIKQIITYGSGKFVFVPDGGIAYETTDLINFTQTSFSDNVSFAITYADSKFVAINNIFIQYQKCYKKLKTLLNTCTYAEYENDIVTYGQCANFAVDIQNNVFRVPLIKDGAVIQQALSDSELGKVYNAGLPNIEGSFSNVYVHSQGSSSGATTSTLISDHEFGDVGAKYYKLNTVLDASKSNSIYGNSDTVQMNAISLRYFVVVANGQTNQSQMDWSKWASNLQGKLNADHSNDSKPYIVETSDKNLMPSWYRVWSDGWCEQGGIVTGSKAATGEVVTLLKPFINTNYHIKAQAVDYIVNDNGTWAKIEILSASTFKQQSGYGADVGYSYPIHWEAKGYIS